jgi:hypothetical protein
MDLAVISPAFLIRFSANESCFFNWPSLGNLQL